MEPKKTFDDSDEFKFTDKTILIVEDTFYNIEYFKAILNNRGLNIIYTESGEEAIKISLEKNIDLILLDIQLPNIDGYEVIKKIKDHKPTMKIIIQTAYSGEEERIKALEAGSIDYISKPINKVLLLTLLKKHLS